MDTFRLPRFDQLGGADRLHALSKVTEQADRDGVLGLLPTGPEEVLPERAVASRTRTVRTRLFLLGYLGKDNGKTRIGKRLREAIGTFQKEAGLHVDQWVGNETWGALQELLSFEEPTNFDRWKVDGQLRPALRRAVETRLYALGLTESRHPRTSDKVTQGLEDFVVVADLFGLSPSRLTPEISPETVAVLFDQDANARCLAEADQAFRFERPLTISKRRAQSLLRKFIVANAKIELWLLGYDVQPGGTRFKSPPSFPYAAGRFPLYHALVSFWQDCGHSTQKARELASSLTGNLFRQLLVMAEQADAVPDPLIAENLFETLTTAKEEDRRSVWKQIQSIGSRIWDGVRRAWRWLKALVLRGIHKAAAWICNTARLAYRFAGNAFRVVKSAFKTATEAIRFMMHKEVPGSDPNHLVIRRDGDFDYLLFLNRDNDPTVVDALLAQFRRQADSFRLALGVLGVLARAMVDLAKKVAFGGWLGFIAALVKLYSQRGIVGDVLRLSRMQEALP